MKIDEEKAAIDATAAQFYGAFTNTNGAPDVDRLYDLFVPDARISSNVGGKTLVYDVKHFIEPRRTILTDGTLTAFEEYETAEETTIFQNIAHRFSRYSKSWRDRSGPKEGSGAKSLQLARISGAWKICALVWDDVET